MALTTSQRLAALENALKQIDRGFLAGNTAGMKVRDVEARLAKLEAVPASAPPVRVVLSGRATPGAAELTWVSA